MREIRKMVCNMLVLLLLLACCAGCAKIPPEERADVKKLPKITEKDSGTAGTEETDQEETDPTGDAQEEIVEPDDLESDDEKPEVEEPEEVEPAEPEPVVTTVTITATGDCTLGVHQNQGYSMTFDYYYDQNGPDYFFDGVRDVFEADDFTLINLECVLSNSEDRVEKEFNLRGKPEYIRIITGSSIEGCSLGNNHTKDYGPQSLQDTIDLLDDARIIYGYNDHVDIYTTEEGIRIGVVSASLLSGASVYENYIEEGIAKLKEEGAQLVIVSCHWGIEREHYPTDYQVQMAHKIIDWGADLIIGNHPHVLQGVEVYQNKIICYSLGNFSFGANRNPDDKQTMMYQQTFTFVDGERAEDFSAKVIPCTISSVKERNDFQPTIAEGETKEAILNNVRAYSEPYSEIGFDEEGIIIIP